MIAFSTAEGSSVNVSSMSTKIGTAPIAKIDSKLATNVNVGIITSSPAPTPALTNATVSAAVPLLTTCAYLVSILFANPFSSSKAFQWLFRIPSKP